jgi:hypothetical protein
VPHNALELGMCSASTLREPGLVAAGRGGRAIVYMEWEAGCRRGGRGDAPGEIDGYAIVQAQRSGCASVVRGRFDRFDRRKLVEWVGRAGS